MTSFMLLGYRYRRDTEEAHSYKPRWKALIVTYGPGSMRLARIAVPALACLFGRAAAADTEAIGTWRVTCPDGPASLGCTMRHTTASLRLGGFRIDLEVQSVGGFYVPVVVASGLPAQAALAWALGRISIGARLDKGEWIELPCSGLLQCEPGAGAAPALARAFPSAASITLRLEVSAPNGREPQSEETLPRPEHTFDLAGTKQALERLKAGGTITTSDPARPGLDWKAMMQRLMRVGGQQ